MPHSHILILIWLFLLRSDSLLLPDLRQIVTSCMLHSQCGDSSNMTDAVCMKNGLCTKDFQKKVCFAYHFLRRRVPSLPDVLLSKTVNLSTIAGCRLCPLNSFLNMSTKDTTAHVLKLTVIPPSIMSTHALFTGSSTSFVCI